MAQVSPRVAVEIERPTDGTLEARASLGLKFLAFLNTAGVVLAMFPGIIPEATLFRVMFNIAGGALAIVYAVEAIGLDRRRPWANAAIRPLLVLIAVAGVAWLVTGLQAGHLRIPFETLVAGWALLGPADAQFRSRLSAWSVALLGAALGIVVVMQTAAPLFGWGGVFDVHRDDVQPVLAVQCTPVNGAPPEHLTLTYEWTWTSGAGLPSGSDIVVVGWSGADSEGRPLYTLDGIPEGATGVYPGMPGDVSTPMADQIATESQRSYRWAIRLEEQQHRPGSIRLALRLAEKAPQGAEPLTVSATYVHAGVWRNEAPRVTCVW